MRDYLQVAVVDKFKLKFYCFGKLIVADAFTTELESMHHSLYREIFLTHNLFEHMYLRFNFLTYVLYFDAVHLHSFHI